MKLDNINYNKLNYETYKLKLKEILSNESLISLGIKHEVLGYTEYNYPLDLISIGNGPKEIFVVGGTHGSEIIGVDFILQLIENISTFEEFDPNLYKIKFIPIQNPEGFDITTSTFNNINETELKDKSFEYYKRYRTDSLISYAFASLNKLIQNFLESDIVLTSEKLLERLKTFVNTDKNWIRLSDERGIPEVNKLNKYINDIDYVVDFEDLKNKLINFSKINLENSNDEYYKLFLTEFKNGFDSNLIWNEIDKKNKQKLYQLMFKDDEFKNIKNTQLQQQIIKQYEEYNHPKGSQIAYDANGSGINLNANNLTNPGIDLLKNNYNVYGINTRDNIVRYFKGPIGSPTRDINNFSYEIENKCLFNLLNDSMTNGNYLCTLLYHGTGGSIFYKPSEKNMDENKYQDYLLYNKTLASVYSLKTDYKMLDNSDTTGYGDYLRKMFPGVLLIELSKMGGNPIGPYGDYDNIYKTINDNLEAFKNILNYYNNYLKKEDKKHSL